MSTNGRPTDDQGAPSPGAAPDIVGVPTAVAAFVGGTERGPVDRAVRLRRFDDYEEEFTAAGLDCPMRVSVRQFFEHGGTEAWIVRAGDELEPTDLQLRGDAGSSSGLHALSNVDLFNLLVVPDRTAGASVLSAAIYLCERRRAMLLLDLPEHVDSVVAAMEWVRESGAGLRSVNVAAYFPRVRALDAAPASQSGSAGVAGAIAGLCARFDRAHGVWMAPAGSEAVLRGVVPSVAVTTADNEALSREGLNCVRTFPVFGTVVWGARTFSPFAMIAEENTYVRVRRLAQFIEESVLRGTRWAAFEPNDEVLWAKLRFATRAFVHDLFVRGALRGATSRDAYFVRCDGETTTPADRARGVVRIVIGVAVIQAAEFTVLQVEQRAGDFAM